MAAILNYNRDHEYSWAAPGHQGGVAFTKSTIGRVFFDFYGENLFRTDTGIERAALGSLLDHTGPIATSEVNSARVFGAHRSYSVLNGTSGSNRVIMNACIGDNQIAVCDRNCHKSIEQGLAQSGGIPVFFLPTRNRFGIIGPIHPDQMTPEAIRRKIADNPLARQAVSQDPVYTVVTNCTYDGMCYNASSVQGLLEQTFDRIHFDEAWYAYARFNPMYRDRYAMRGDPRDHPANGPTLFATQSTHKLLAALSQASFIHVRDGRRPIEHGRFNESYVAQGTTSPLYAIIAANDVATAMVEGSSGHALTQEVIDEAVDCRLAFARGYKEFARRGEWFFKPWNAEEVLDPSTGKRVPFDEAPRELLTSDPNYWVLHPGETWHGFEGLDDGRCMLDPIKFGPAAVVTAYLGRDGIIPSRTTDHMVLFLFSIGVTRGKWGTLINTLLDFKRDYDRNAPLADVVPGVVAADPARYAGMGLKDLGDEMWAYMRINRHGYWMAQAYSQLPAPELRPRDAFQKLMAGQSELLPVEQVANRVSGVGVIPYPPGIPIVMPGENFGPADGPWLSYVSALQEWGERFPGFEAELEGAEIRDGKYRSYCLK